MAIVQFSIQIFYTVVLLALAAMVLTCYYALFYVVMIALDGCEICKKLRALRSQAAHGHSLSRT